MQAVGSIDGGIHTTYTEWVLVNCYRQRVNEWAGEGGGTVNPQYRKKNPAVPLCGVH